MGLLSLLFSFNGRINRVQYWLGGIGVTVVGFMLFFGIGMSAIMTMAGAGSDAERMRALSGLGLLVPVLLIMSWIGFALQIKRFHDRGRTGYLVLLPMAVSTPMMMTAMGHLLAGAHPTAVAAAIQPYQTVLWIIQLAFFIDLGCLPSVGPNKHGHGPGLPPSADYFSDAPKSPAPAPAKTPATAPAAMTSLFGGAQSAMDRAIEEAKRQPMRPAATAKAAPSAFGGSAPATSFGRRATR